MGGAWKQRIRQTHLGVQESHARMSHFQQAPMRPKFDLSRLIQEMRRETWQVDSGVVSGTFRRGT